MRAPSLDAVLFDMDGVVTDTTGAHAAAWKRLFDEYLRQRAKRLGEEFRPFDPRRDYLRYVDGKPRSGGVASFLASRGIELPEGSRDDGPEAETVRGLGNRKDSYFLSWLAENRVMVYPGSLRLVHALRRAGVPVAMFSASRNAEAVLENAGVLDLFDVRVDGSDAAQLGLPGKPDPAMLLEAARRLGAAPGRTAVFEDAIAGVTAAARGGFGLVIGVARAAAPAELTAAGAHWIVDDLAELRFDAYQGLRVHTLADLPGVWTREQEVRHRLSLGTPVAFFDYDGTLTPIVEEHEQALLADDMRARLADLAGRCPVVIVSGRDLSKLREFVGLGSVWYAGSHGLEIEGPEGQGVKLEMGGEFLPELDALEKELTERLAPIEGHAVERKRFSIAVHYRQVAKEALGQLRSTLDELLTAHQGLRMGHGKKVYEIRPDIDWHKGRAVRWVLERIGSESAPPVPVYVGDDLTDEDAFRSLAGHGVCVAVRHEESRPTAADYALSDVDDVRAFLEWLRQVVEHRVARDGAET